jgi:HSP20 family protein
MALEFRDGDALVIQADLPGLDPERDIEVSIVSDVLHIRARGNPAAEPGDHPSDVRYGDFVRYIGLPVGCAEDQVTARYRDDVLEVRAPAGRGHRVPSIRIPVVQP